MKLRLCVLCILCVSVGNALALDREAFTFTSYDLNASVEPEQQRLGVRGSVTLRNDSPTPQRIAVLQISSSLEWRSIQANKKPCQFVLQPYTSDIDHTGALSEAIVTLPESVPPQASIDLEIAYEGVIVLDATRLTRIGTPADAARSTDWDEITIKFTAVRGVGYVAWYPIATESADISDGTNFFDVLGRWKAREAGSQMHVQVGVIRDDGERAELIVNEASCRKFYEQMGRSEKISADCTYRPLGFTVPTFVTANYAAVEQSVGDVQFLTGHDASATVHANAMKEVVPFITDWLGAPHRKVQTADLPDPNAAPFESGSLLLTPLTSSDSRLAGLAAAHQLTHAAFSSQRPWINEGLAHFAQALYLERQSGRQAALDYMGLHRSALSMIDQETAKQTAPGPKSGSEDEARKSLVNTADEELYRSKAMFVWWMLRDLIGEPGLKKALASYRPEQDKEPSYMPRLIQAQTQRDLEWFFDDWVYRDRGLPEFKVASAFTRKMLPEGYMVAITVDNAGAAGAEVPLTVRFAGGEITKRLLVRSKGNGVIRVEVPKPPEEILVNDGSVPESDKTNNRFKIKASEVEK